MRTTCRQFVICLLLIPLHYGIHAQEERPPATESLPLDFSPQGPYAGPLPIPHIARFRELPMRMNLEPLVYSPGRTQVLDERLMPLFERILREAKDPEIQEVAALSLVRVAQMQLAEFDTEAEALLSLMKSSGHERVQFACAFALSAANIQSSAAELVQLAAAGNDTQRMLLEAALARWKADAAKELWRARLTDPLVSEVSLRLAIEGITALNDTASLESLRRFVGDESASFGNRMAAVKALALLDAEQAYELSEALIAGSISQKLLGLALLDNTKPESCVRTVQLCEDKSDAVASVAWQQVLRRQSDLLQSYLPSGRVHRDAQVRIAAARVMKLYPTSERTTWLHLLLSDFHIEVRNVARQMLVAVATEHPELKKQIIEEAGDTLTPDSPDWQGIEQSLVLLGQLKAAHFSQQCVPLLKYPRDEVLISAAWMMHLFPDEAVRPAVLEEIRATETQLADLSKPYGEAPLKQSLLFQYAGLMRMREIEGILDSKFSKTAPGGYVPREGALWALGILYENNPDPDMAAKFAARVRDRASVPPESPDVRRLSVVALGVMRSIPSIPVVREAFKDDPPETLIPGTARLMLPLLKEPMPDPIPPAPMFIGGWRINPVEK